MNDIDTAERVYLVDDDPALRKALSRLLRTNGWRVDTFESAEAFLEGRDPQALACLVLDVTLPGLDGIELQQTLVDTRQAMPIVFLTGYGDIPMSVQAMRTGASNFLTKPVTAQALCSAIRLAMDEATIARRSQTEATQLRQRLARLTPREREVLEAIAAGKLNKQIAGDLGVVEQTVKFHRARIMERMQAHSAAELMRMAAQLAIGEDTRS
jgi:FixJ family two-component response regulator